MPLVRDMELALKYAPEKGFQVVAAIPADAVPHSLFMSVGPYFFSEPKVNLACTQSLF